MQQRALARGADAGDFVERALHEILLALGSVRADGEAMGLVAQALHKEQGRVAHRQFERLAPFDEKRLAAGVAVRPFGD